MSNNPNRPTKSLRRLTLEQYTVALFAPLHEELTAARVMLDEEHEKPFRDTSSDKNSYEYGTIKNHNVVIVSLPLWHTGNASSSTSISQMISTFPNIRITLLVGIGGGIPRSPTPPKSQAKGEPSVSDESSRRRVVDTSGKAINTMSSDQNEDIRLGDVVIGWDGSKRLAVIDWDSNDRSKMSNILPQPDRRVLTALTRFISNLDLRRAKLQENLARFDIEESLKLMHSYPGNTKDILFKSDYHHPIHAQSCDKCSKKQQVKRPRRQQRGFQLHFGTIASTSVVVKDPAKRDQMRDEVGALCVEMEATGVLSHNNCLVIRGISDYADSHKNDAWRRYAAATAASVARELLYNIDGDDVMTLEPLMSASDVECLQKFKEWSGSYEQFKNLNPDRTPGTCRWVLNHEKFRAWNDNQKNDLLWITADPGCGKSVLAKSLVDQELKADPSRCTSTCYYFFKDNQGQNNLNVALCAILHQLFSQRHELIRFTLPYHQNNGDRLKDETDELWRLLIEAATDDKAGQVICVFDALDECSDTGMSRLVGKIKEFWNYQTRESKLKFLLTSRPYQSIERQWYFSNKDVSTIRVPGEESNEQISKEINLVIDDWIAKFARDTGLSPSSTEILTTGLKAVENRTYLWLHLVMDVIKESDKKTPKKLKTLIKSLPTSIDQAYENMLNKTKDRNATEAILRIVVGAKEPLSLREMNVAFELALDDKINSFDELEEELDDELNVKKRIRDLCGLFVFVAGSKIYLIHQTAKEFLLRETMPPPETLTWKNSLTVANCDALMARICIQYCLFKDFPRDSDYGWWSTRAYYRSTRDHRWRPNYRPTNYSKPRSAFFGYAVQFWNDHYLTGQEEKDAPHPTLVAQLYDLKTRENLWSRSNMSLSGMEFQKALPLEFPTFVGHLTVAKYYLENMTSLDPMNDFQTSFSRATKFSQLKVMYWLVKNGAAIDAPDQSGRTPLSWAAASRDSKTVQWLVENGAAIDAPDQSGRTPLSWAAASRDSKTVQWLVENGAAIDAPDQSSRTPLSWAAASGRLLTVRWLVENGAAIDAPDQSGWTPLSWAAISTSYERLETVQWLVEKGVAIDAPDQSGRTPLSWAAASGRLLTVRWLVEKGAAIDDPDQSGRTPLSWTASDGDLMTVEWLVEKGAAINVSDRSGRTPLSWAAGVDDKYSPRIVQWLVEKGTSIDSIDVSRRTPLFWAAIQGSSLTVSYLIQNGGNIMQIDSTGETALHLVLLQPLVLKRTTEVAIILTDEANKSKAIE